MESWCHNPLYCPMSDPLAPSLCPRCDMPCRAMSCHAVSCHVMPCHVVPRRAARPAVGRTITITKHSNGNGFPAGRGSLAAPGAAHPVPPLLCPLSLPRVPCPFPVSPIPPCPTSSWSHVAAGPVGGCSPGEYIIYTVVSHSRLTVYDDILPRGAGSVPEWGPGGQLLCGGTAWSESRAPGPPPQTSASPLPCPPSPTTLEQDRDSQQPPQTSAPQLPPLWPPSPAAPEQDEGSKYRPPAPP